MIQLRFETLGGPATLAYDAAGNRVLLAMPARATELTAAQCLELARRLRNAALVLEATQMARNTAALRRPRIVPVLDVHTGGRP